MPIQTGVAALTAIVLLLSTACSNSTADNTASEDRGAASDVEVSGADRSFVENAVASGRLEIEHAKLAQARSANPAVKEYATRLLVAHVAADQELLSIMQRRHIVLTDAGRQDDRRGSIGARDDATTATKTGERPTGSSSPTGSTGASGSVVTTGEAIDRERSGMTYPWMQATGAAFDEGFLSTQVKAHQDAIALFVEQNNTGADPELKAFAAKHLPALRAHLEQAQELQRGMRQTQ
jgi:putative membrane protein